jgi:hypothetical protein
MQEHHSLGSLPKIGETLWYIASWGEEWVALLSFSASALKCAARDGWIGWDFRQRYSRLKLVVNKQPLSHSAGPACFQPGIAGSVALRKASEERLGRKVRSWRGVAGNLCRPATLSGDGLSGGQLGVCGKHEGISPDPPGVYRDPAIPQDGLRPTLAGQRP